MGRTPQPQDTVGDGRHYWSRPESVFDPSKVKPHTCMTNIQQRGNYIHCFDGNHGMRIPAGKILNKDDNGNWILEDIIIRSGMPESPRGKLSKNRSVIW